MPCPTNWYEIVYQLTEQLENERPVLFSFRSRDMQTSFNHYDLNATKPMRAMHQTPEWEKWIWTNCMKNCLDLYLILKIIN